MECIVASDKQQATSSEWKCKRKIKQTCTITQKSVTINSFTYISCDTSLPVCLLFIFEPKSSVFKLSCHSLIVRSFRMKKDYYYLFIFMFLYFHRSFFCWFFNRSQLSTLKAWLVYEISIWHAKSLQMENLVMFDTRIRFYSCSETCFFFLSYLSFSLQWNCVRYVWRQIANRSNQLDQGRLNDKNIKK